MDSFVTIRLADFALTGEEAQVGTASTNRPPPPVVEISDEVLVAQVAQGSREALASLFRRHARIVRRVAYRILRNASEADDLVQEIFLLVHRECKAFDASKSPARFWILQIAHRRAISRRRYLSSRHFYSRIDLDDAATDPQAISDELDDLIDQRLENDRLNQALASLSEDQQKTLRLFFIEGYTFDEIATKLGHSRGNVKNHYFRGLEKLRKAFFGSKLPGERAV
jgi:RNA polymerase sigma-70 factor (ECF subfamily)